MMRGLMAVPGGAPLTATMREWASADTGATAIGVFAGVAIGEWIGTAVSEYLKLEAGWADIAGKAIGKGIISFVLFAIGKKTSGITRVFMNGAAIGAIASILGDVVSQLTGPALGLGLPSSVKGITVKVNKNTAPPVGARNNVITSV